MRCPILLACIALALPAPTLAAAGFTGVGDLAGGPTSSQAFGVSPDGRVVVGQSDSASGPEAFRWRVDHGLEGLGDVPGGAFWSSATDASTDGSVIVGASQNDLSVGGWGYRWTEAGGMVPIGPPGLSTSGGATAVSGDGSRIVGDQLLDFQLDYEWTTTGGYAEVVALAEEVHLGDVSTDGSSVAGEAFNDGNLFHFEWVAHRDYAVVPDSNPITGKLNGAVDGMSADGSVLVGQYRNEPISFDLTTAFRWEAGTGVGLGTLGGALSRATAASDDGSLVVGWSDTATARQAFLWDSGGGMRSLHAELTGVYGLDLTGWTLEEATSVSGDGNVIVGFGTNPAGDPEGFVAVLETACSNGADDDGDGASDLADAGCSDPSDLSERTPFVACDDGLDNDDDGLVDVGVDPGCKSALFNLEDPVCQNGEDDDGDAGFDFDGGAAANGGVPLGPADVHCGQPWRSKETPGSRCGLGAEVGVVIVLLWASKRRRRA